MRLVLVFILGCPLGAVAEANPESPLSLAPYHLTARPWTPSKVDNDAILDAVESLCRFAAAHIDDSGAFIDPVLKREFQYATPYMAYALGALVAAGREGPWLELGIKTMDHATTQVAAGNRGIPDRHGEFYLAPLAGALAFYEGKVEGAKLLEWRRKLRTPLLAIIEDETMKINNWRTYAMRGEWLRVGAGLASKDEATQFVEQAWHERTQRMRIVPSPWNLYQDWNGHPQSHAVEAVGRVNLLGLALSGYDGPSADELKRAVLRGTEASLLLQDPTGQCPPNGRTDNHVFNDVLYQLSYEMMAEQAHAEGDAWRAGQYRRAANLAFESIQRWMRDDAPWAGMYSITKNHLDPAARVGYQPASQVSNYTGATAFHLAEAWHARKSSIEERPAPTEIGGYILESGPMFGSVVANAGGMQVFLNLLGDSVAKYDAYWTPLGVARFSRVGWDSRLGPSDGARDGATGKAAVFGPAWQRMGIWTNLGEMAEHYRGAVQREFVHPLLVRFEVLYSPVTGVGGPQFYMHFSITPDGVLIRTRRADDKPVAMTIPLLQNDGRALETHTKGPILSTKYSDSDEQQHFLILSEGWDVEIENTVMSAYGELLPVRVRSAASELLVFVYPEGRGDPDVQTVFDSFSRTPQGWKTVLGEVGERWYRGRFSSGGQGTSIPVFDNDAPLQLNPSAGILIQRDGDRLLRMESDGETTARLREQSFVLKAHHPQSLP